MMNFFWGEILFVLCLVLFRSLVFLYLVGLVIGKVSLKTLVKVESMVVVFIFVVYFFDHQIFI